MRSLTKEEVARKYSKKFSSFRAISHKNKHEKWEAWFECENCGAGKLRRGVKKDVKSITCPVCRVYEESSSGSGAPVSIDVESLPGYAGPSEKCEISGRRMAMFYCPCGCGEVSRQHVLRSGRPIRNLRHCKGVCTRRDGGFYGVDRIANHGKYKSCIYYEGKAFTVGRFDTQFEGAICRDQLIIDLGIENKFSLTKIQREVYCGQEKKYIRLVRQFPRGISKSRSGFSFSASSNGTTVSKYFSTVAEAKVYREQFARALEMIEEAS